MLSFCVSHIFRFIYISSSDLLFKLLSWKEWYSSKKKKSWKEWYTASKSWKEWYLLGLVFTKNYRRLTDSRPKRDKENPLWEWVMEIVRSGRWVKGVIKSNIFIGYLGWLILKQYSPRKRRTEALAKFTTWSLPKESTIWGPWQFFVVFALQLGKSWLTVQPSESMVGTITHKQKDKSNEIFGWNSNTKNKSDHLRLGTPKTRLHHSFEWNSL